MASVEHSPPPHSPPGPDAKRPKGILKHSFSEPRKSPPASDPDGDHVVTNKEVTLANTQINAGHRRSSSKGPPVRRRSSHSTVDVAENSQRLKWDEANLYLTEQERTATMKITEPKTPYAKHYDPSEDPSDNDGEGEDYYQGQGGDQADAEASSALENTNHRRKAPGPGTEDDIPGLSLGEPEEEVPEGPKKTEGYGAAAGASFSSSSARSPGEKTVHLEQEAIATPSAEEAVVGLSAEEIEKHHRFEEMRKKHYEMRDVAQILGHPEAIPDDEDEDEDMDEDGAPPVPPLPRVNGSA